MLSYIEISLPPHETPLNARASKHAAQRNEYDGPNLVRYGDSHTYTQTHSQSIRCGF